MLAQLIDVINRALGIILLIGLGAVIVYRNIRVSIAMAGKEFKNRDTKNGGNDEQIISFALISRTIYLSLTLVIPQVIIIGFIWLVPLLFATFLDPAITRWGIISSASTILVYFFTKKFGGYRGLASIVGHLAILLLGWIPGKWLGIIFISIPFIGLYYYLLYHIAEVVIPASNPESAREKFERYKIFVSYMWGTQYPIIVVPNRANAKALTRINGSVFQNFTGIPGYIWTNAYQIVGLSSGTTFLGVEGPGAIYTRRFERVKEVMDLRTHLRTKDIGAITRDGIWVQATLFASFCIDRLPFDNKLRSRLRHAGSYPYSRPHVQAVLRLEGVSATPSGSLDPALRWDDQVMSKIEETAREVIAETSLEELWLPSKDAEGVSAPDLIASKILDRLTDFQKQNSIHLFSARIVHYTLPDKDKPWLDGISIQQLPVWSTRWEKISKQKLTEVTAESEQKQLDITALASSLLLKSIADSLLNTSVRGSFPRYLIAMHFLDILDDMIRTQPERAGDKGTELLQRIAMIRGNS